MVPPIRTFPAGPLLVIERSAEVTVVSTMVASFSGLRSASDVTDAALIMSVPDAVPEGMWVTIVNVVEAPAASDDRVQLTVPPAPGAGVLQAKAGPDWLSDTNVKGAGRLSMSATVVAAFGPLFATVME